MLECLVLGDSLAVGVAQIRTECVAYAKSGINSHTWLNQNVGKNLNAKTVIISLGSNDTAQLDTYEELLSMRQLVKADRVFWILPNIKETKRKAVWLVAKQFNDQVLDARNYDRSADTVHPTYRGYKSMAQDTK